MQVDLANTDSTVDVASSYYTTDASCAGKTLTNCDRFFFRYFFFRFFFRTLTNCERFFFRYEQSK